MIEVNQEVTVFQDRGPKDGVRRRVTKVGRKFFTIEGLGRGQQFSLEPSHGAHWESRPANRGGLADKAMTDEQIAYGDARQIVIARLQATGLIPAHYQPNLSNFTLEAIADLAESDI